MGDDETPHSTPGRPVWTPQPGWYPDPWAQAPLRWYDGTAWTPHLQLAPHPSTHWSWPGPQPPKRSGQRGVAAIVAVIVALSTLLVLEAVGSEQSVRCAPDDTQCVAGEVLDDSLWEVGDDEELVIHYQVNPENPDLSEDEVIRAVQAAAGAWEEANPRIQFVYDGVTDAQAGVQDGKNVIGTGEALEGSVAYEESWIDDDGWVIEADVVLAEDVWWVWEPCTESTQGCGGYATLSGDAAAGYERGEVAAEVQAILTHELGHVLSLGHPPGALSTTMSTEWDNLSLHPQTLALGDVLAVREAYPCGKCSGPPEVQTP